MTLVPRYDGTVKAYKRSVENAVSPFTRVDNIDGSLSCSLISTSTSVYGVRPRPSGNIFVVPRRLLQVSLDFGIIVGLDTAV